MVTILEPVEITGREMYDAILALTRQVAIMVEKVDRLCSVSYDQENRIRKLEGRRWPFPVLQVVTPLVAVLVSVVFAVWSLT